jgi:hypothetical protein
VNTLSEKAVDFSNTSAQIYAEKDGGFSRKDGGYQEQMEVASAFSESRKCLPPHHQQICLVKKNIPRTGSRLLQYIGRNFEKFTQRDRERRRFQQKGNRTGL